jgi:hypothetical protein
MEMELNKEFSHFSQHLFDGNTQVTGINMHGGRMASPVV